MLYYFSGTGNSRYVCEKLSRLLGEEICPITTLRATKDSSIGIVFPVYAWGMPQIVRSFIEKELEKLILPCSDAYIYIVMTCGDDMGYTDRLVASSLLRTGRSLSAAFSVRMPNTYISLPGFDIDSEELASWKIETTTKALPHIASIVQSRSNATEVVRGGMAWVKTYLLRPLFVTFLMGDSRFRVKKQCTGCGKCSKVCPVANIAMSATLSDGARQRPLWKHHCEGCLACYHVCPKHAIEYGAFTKGKGQKKALLQVE